MEAFDATTNEVKTRETSPNIKIPRAILEKNPIPLTNTLKETAPVPLTDRRAGQLLTLAEEDRKRLFGDIVSEVSNVSRIEQSTNTAEKYYFGDKFLNESIDSILGAIARTDSLKEKTLQQIFSNKDDSLSLQNIIKNKMSSIQGPEMDLGIMEKEIKRHIDEIKDDLLIYAKNKGYEVNKDRNFISKKLKGAEFITQEEKCREWVSILNRAIASPVTKEMLGQNIGLLSEDKNIIQAEYPIEIVLKLKLSESYFNDQRRYLGIITGKATTYQQSATIAMQDVFRRIRDGWQKSSMTKAESEAQYNDKTTARRIE